MLEIKFRDKVFEEVSRIPKGKVSTYKIIAQNINSKAYRAIGQVLKTNKDIVRIPCHRVVKSNGEIGGYFGDESNEAVNRKVEILKKEGIEIINNKITDLNKYLFNIDSFDK